MMHVFAIGGTNVALSLSPASAVREVQRKILIN
jgi:hypothetical protein